MKKLLIILSGLTIVLQGRSQSMAEVQKLAYYERYDTAAGILQNLVKANPNNAEAWWLMTQAYLHQGKIKAIKDSLLSIPASNLQPPYLLCAYGSILLQENKKDSAGIYFAKALEETKERDPQVMLAIAKAHIDAAGGDAAYAVELLTKAIKRDKRNAALYVALGNSYRRLQNGTESYKAYQEALAQDAGYAEASYRLGKIFLAQGNTEMYLKYFNDAVSTDPLYAPAWYELYYHYYFRDVNKAMDCLNHFIAASDKSIHNDYLVTDLLYASKKYKDAIDKARELMERQGASSEPRLYKLIAYSYKELNDSAKAFDFMRRYFKEQADTGFVVKDFEMMGEIYDKMVNNLDSAVAYYAKAGELEKDSVKRLEYDKKLADIYKKLKDYRNQARWLGEYYHGNPNATNLDLFNWGVANYMAKDFQMADSVFGLYEAKHPDQFYGYYWRARSDAAIDTAMATGLAIPHYLKLIGLTEKDSANHSTRKHLIEAYGYVAAYKANTEKDYSAAIEYFDKLLALDPGNTEARKYIEILKKNQSKAQSRASTKDVEKTGKDIDAKSSGGIDTKTETSKTGG
ncbi:MAG: tetratricopeptide repeat protein [Puia sp.]|nr:tetratricopeptide repeat protein [Puia sp.]